MGKKSKKKKSTTSTSRARSNHAQSHSQPHPSEDFEQNIPRVSLDDVKLLPQVPDHIWKVVVYQEGNDEMVIGVMDMTNQMFPPQSDIPRAMRFGSIPMINEMPSQDEALNLIFNGMKNPPSCRDDDDLFYCPRRPRFLLLDPKLKSICPYIKSQIESVSVPVRLYSDFTYTESVFAVEQEKNKHEYLQHATFARGLSTATAAAVRLLPQDPNETWKIFLYDHEGSPTGSILVVENHTNKKGKTMVGNGVTGMASIGLGILATMLSPVRGKRGGNDVGGYEPDTPRRPGRILLVAGAEAGFDHLQEVMLGSGVDVLKDTEYSGKFSGCSDPECDAQVGFRAKDNFMRCSCKAAAYCDKDCQMAHWKEHKKTCQWHADKKRGKKL